MKEKSAQEKKAAERQVSLITDALSKAAGNNGVWLNEEGKQYPRFYPKGAAVSPFNAMVLGIKLRQERICHQSVHTVQRSQETRRGGDGT